MKKFLIPFIMLLICSLPLAAGEAHIMPVADPESGKPVPVPAVASFDINAYLAEPLISERLQINVYDNISMRTGALNNITAESVEAIGDNFMGIDPFISDLLSTAGISIMTVDCNGKMAPGSTCRLTIGFEVLSSKTKDGSVPAAGEPVRGFQNTETDAQIPYILTFRKDRSHNIAVSEADVPPEVEVFNAGSSLPYVLKAAIPGTALSDEWSFQGSLHLNIDRKVYDNSPMGKYRTVIKINLSTGV